MASTLGASLLAVTSSYCVAKDEHAVAFFDECMQPSVCFKSVWHVCNASAACLLMHLAVGTDCNIQCKYDHRSAGLQSCPKCSNYQPIRKAMYPVPSGRFCLIIRLMQDGTYHVHADDTSSNPSHRHKLVHPLTLYQLLTVSVSASSILLHKSQHLSAKLPI